MSARDNVNIEQFSLFGPPERVEEELPDINYEPTYADTYTQYGADKRLVDNPLYDARYDDYARNVPEADRVPVSTYGDASTRKRQFIPTESLVSMQMGVNEAAVDHLAGSHDAHPSVLAKGAADGKWVIADGNHRANAAQRRGQLFLAASTYDAYGAAPSLGVADDSDLDEY